ncbi:OPT super, partial [Coemansia sp. RSA 2705]
MASSELDISSLGSTSELIRFDSPQIDIKQGFLGNTYCPEGPSNVPADRHRSPALSADGIESISDNQDNPAAFVPSAKAWVCALVFTTIEAMVSPLFLFRAYSMPITPLLIPVFVYPLCRWSSLAAGSDGGSGNEISANSDPDNGQVLPIAANMDGPTFKNNCIMPESVANKPTMVTNLCTRFTQWRRHWRFEMFTREEMVWITSMVAAGGSFAPAYQWIATIDIDYGQPLGQWQQFMVVLSTQLFGWSLGHMLRHIFVGRQNGIVWPDTLPLSFLIQALYSKRMQSTGANGALTESSITVDGRFADEENLAEADPGKRVVICEDDCEYSESEFGAATTSKKHLAVLTGVTFVYQVIISYIAPIFKSLCLLCLWAPRNKLISLLGSGWNGAGILSLTFDWEALGTLQPLITPLWAQVQYYAGAFLMMYILTPIGWHLDWWGTQSQPIVSTNVFDTAGNVYNISLVHRMRNPDADIEQYDHYVPGMLTYKTYSPVRLTVNSALGYICSVAAITAVIVHLALWHPQWLRQATSDMAHALLRLWDPRPLFRARRPPASAQTESDPGNSDTSNEADHHSQARVKLTWNIGYIIGRIGRVLIFTLTLGVAILSPQLDISALPGWQTLIAMCWSIIMCLPIGFVEAVTGFTLPMDLLPHMLGGLMQGPGTPIETSYFHLWATVPIRVALGWPGVRSFQLAHHCCPQEASQPDNLTFRPRRLLPWLKRGLLIGIVWGACVNHLSYTVFSRSLDERRSLPIETPTVEPPSTPDIFVNLASSDPADILEEYYDNEENADDLSEIGSPILGWHEPGEFGRLPAALSSELVVWGIVGPLSIFSASSPYRMLFVFGALIGLLLPPLFYVTHRLCLRITRRSLDNPGWPHRIARRVADAAKAIQIPLVLTGM